MVYGIDKRIASMMVEFDISKGFQVEIEIICGRKKFCQKLDYRNIHFRYYYCRDVGHVKA